MEKLPVIPTPLRTRWREFCQNFLPVMTFAGVLGATALMWRSYVVPPNVLAEVETITANVITTQPGVLVSFNVERFQRVTNGQEICQVLILETNALSASLDAIQSDLELMRSRLEIDAVRNSMIYEKERLAFLSEVVQHNINRVLLRRYKADFLRTSNLFYSKTPLVSQAQYDQALTLYDKYRVDVDETGNFLMEKSNALPRLHLDSSNLLASVERDIAAQEAKLKATSQNLILRAPMDGIVSAISNRLGERVVAGKPIVVITPLSSDRIIAYLRQPMNLNPKTNEWVQVRRQTFRREVGYGRIVQVGTQLELIDRALLASQGSTIRYEMGLPFLVQVRDRMDLAPGERVDVILPPRRSPPAN
jgi:multidrug resistance efflux pump